MNNISAKAAVPRPVSRPTVSLQPTRRRLTRAITAGVVVMPAIGTALALGLALRHGVGRVSLICFAVTYILSTLGVTLGFHRHFAHRAFRTSKAMQVVFIILGSAAMQGPLLYWVATHRRHHQFSDGPEDPHSPHTLGGLALGYWRGFFHGHIGWMFSGEMTNVIQFAPDIIRDAKLFRLQRQYPMWAGLFLLLPGVVAGVITHSFYGGLEAFLWAGPVRLFIVHHASWAVGSISHMHGARPFPLPDRSANNFWVALFAFGEGLQNNHHAFPSAAHHGFRWWEPDLTGVLINLIERTGLIWSVNRPGALAIAARQRGTTQTNLGSGN